MGYVLKFDLEIRNMSMHSDLLFYPTREKPPGKQEKKLLATLYDLKCYRNLQQCTRHDFRITKIHRILQFAHKVYRTQYKF